MKYKDGKRSKEICLNITFGKKNNNTEGSFKVLNMVAICYWAVFKGRTIKNILNLNRKRSEPGGTSSLIQWTNLKSSVALGQIS